MPNRRFTNAAKALLKESQVNFKDMFKDGDTDHGDFRMARSRGVPPDTLRSLVEKINAMKLRRKLDDSLIVLDPVEHSEPVKPARRARRSRHPLVEPTGTLRDTADTSAEEAALDRTQFEDDLAPPPEIESSRSRIPTLHVETAAPRFWASNEFESYEPPALGCLLDNYLRRLIRRFDNIDLPLRLDFPATPSLESLYVDLPLEPDSDTVPPLKLRNVDLPLAIERAIERAYSLKGATSLIRGIRQAAVERGHSLMAEYSLAELLAAKMSTLILGDPGCGKSTLLAYYIVQLAHLALPNREDGGTSRVRSRQASLPVVLVCRDLIGVRPASIKALLLRQLECMGFVGKEGGLLAEYLAGQLGNGRATLFVDALDELPTVEARRTFSKSIIDHERASGFTFCITSRAVGFNAIRDLFSGVQLFSIGQLRPNRQSAYVENWTAFDPATDAKLLRERVLVNSAISRLTKNAFTLALAVQLCALDSQPLTRRIDLLRRTIRMMIERQRIVDGQTVAAFNEVQPHLERLAYSMRARFEPEQHLAEDEVLRIFSELRDAEPDEPELRRRSPQALLNAIIERIGLITVVGARVDQRGFERNQIQFVHQLFQEYFIAQAILHRRGGRQATVGERLQVLLKTPDGTAWSLMDQPTPLGSGEPVIAEPWHQAISLAIASLDNSDCHSADGALRAILPGAGAPADVRRACATLALQTLADEPLISDECALDVFRAATNELRNEDGWDRRYSLMATAVSAVSCSRFGPLLRDYLLRLVRECRGQEQLQVAWLTLMSFECFAMEAHQQDAESLAHTLEFGEPERRIEAVLQFLSLVKYRWRDQVLPGFTTPVFHRLLSQVIHCNHQPLRLCLLSSASTLVSSEFRTPFGRVTITPPEANVLLALASELEDSDPALGFVANLLSCVQVESPIFVQRDWLQLWDAVAAGKSPQCHLPLPERALKTNLAVILHDALERATTDFAQERIALALGAIGVFCDGMADPLMRRVRRDYYLDGPSRDEALFYLANVRSSRSTQMLLDGISISDNPENVSRRCVLGLLAVGEPESLSKALLSSTTQEHLSAFAFGLAGIADPRGRQVLRELTSHDSHMIRESATEALKKAEIWGLV